MMLKIGYFLIAVILSACDQTNNTHSDLQPVVSAPSPATPTIISNELYCENYDLIQEIVYSDQTSEISVVEQNSEECGYQEPQFAPAGTLIGDPYCGNTLAQDRFNQLLGTIQKLRGLDTLQDYADGNGGTYTSVVTQLDQTCFVEMEPPPDCPTTATNTDDSRYSYMTCDGVKQKTDVSFPYDPNHTGLAVIDMLVVVDTKLTDEDRAGMTITEFVLKQLRDANEFFLNSNVEIAIRLAGIKEVTVAPGDLRRQYRAFFDGTAEFSNLSEWQLDSGADIAFLFKKIENDPIACGVASVDATKGITKSRGIIQCFHNSVFQESEVTRYYNRANETFIHEIGHLLGLEHHWQEEDNPAGTGLFEHSYGYLVNGYNPQSENLDYQGVYGGYGTIMSYADLGTEHFSDPDTYFNIEENGKSVRLGTYGGCFCLIPIEQQPPATDAHQHLQRVRYIMSQLNEKNHNIQYSLTARSIDLDVVDVCLF